MLTGPKIDRRILLGRFTKGERTWLIVRVEDDQAFLSECFVEIARICRSTNHTK